MFEKAKKNFKNWLLGDFNLRIFDAAKTGRLFGDWSAGGSSADAEIRGSIKRMRDRARDLERNNDYFRRFLKLLNNNVLGHKGLRLKMNIREEDRRALPDKEANRLVHKHWKEWTKKKNCSVSGRYSWKQIQALSLRSVARDGEFFIQEVTGADNPYGYSLRILEADRVDEQLNRRLDDGNVIKMGIEINRDNKIVAMHILTNHPGEETRYNIGARRSERIPAEQLIHLFITEREGQTRGIPWTVSAMTRLKMLEGYEEASLVHARMGASQAGFLEQDNDGDSKTPAFGKKLADGSSEIDIEAGAIYDLPAGKKFVPWDPSYPHSEYDPFIKSNLRGVASGWGVSYFSLANDLKGVNYTSSRTGLLEDREEWKELQQFLIEDLCEVVFERWLRHALMMGALTNEAGNSLPVTKFDKFNKPMFLGRRWQWVDPQREVDANVKTIVHRLKSRRDIIEEQGGDIEDTFQDIEDEAELADEHGIELIEEARPESDDSGVSNAEKMQMVISNAVEEAVKIAIEDSES